MQEINLLQNKVKDRTLQFERSNRFVLILFTLVVVLEIASIGTLYFLTHNTRTKTEEVIAETKAIQDTISSNQKDLVLAKGLQAQLKNVNSLLKNRVSWTAFLDQIANVTPSKIQFESINAAINDKKIHMEGAGSSYADVGRLLLSLSTSDKFRDVKLHGISPPEGTTFGYKFSIDFTVVDSIFKKP